MQINSLGFPRIGQKRELKFSLEKYWRGEINQDELVDTAKTIKHLNWQWQAESGVNLIPVGDFAYYDHVLNTSALLNVIPKRHRKHDDKIDLNTLMRVARGRDSERSASCCVSASEMTKFFNTNYHYIVPELEENQEFSIGWQQIFEEVEEAKSLGYIPKPILIGPVTYLHLARQSHGDFDKLSLLDNLIKTYQHILAKFASQGVDWVQLDEPILTLELDPQWQQAIKSCYQSLADSSVKLLLASYYGSIEHNKKLVTSLPLAGIHLDLSAAPEQLSAFLPLLNPHQVLSAGIINGRNIWAADLDLLANKLTNAHTQLTDKLWLATSCSLLHSPVDLALETKLRPEIKDQLAFSKQKLIELQQLKDILLNPQKQASQAVIQQCQARRTEQNNARLVDVCDRIKHLTHDDYQRPANFAERLPLQQAKLNLPLLPTTTIGSYPQTKDLRELRKKWRHNKISNNEYQNSLKTLIKDCIERQQNLEIDVLVHGEAERNDMVEFFADKLNGVAVTEFAWVQSYGSRCVKPPIIYADVNRKEPMTLELAKFAQSQTQKPVKGMLTGPVTLLHWSFAREDIPKSEVATQLALAVRDEVNDLQKAGIQIIQIDEPALREGLPLKQNEWEHYLNWSVNTFKLSSSIAWSETQIHTHMCYSNFNDIIESIARLDADVITIETSRSGMSLLNAFENFNYPNQIGPGVYDIHSPNIPDVSQIEYLIIEAAKKIPVNQLWINPDCGLKTRNWQEVEAALTNMVQAAKNLRQKLG